MTWRIRRRHTRRHSGVSSRIVTSRHWTALGHLRRNHTFEILLLRFKTQVSQTQGCLIHWCNFKKQPSIYQCTVKHALVRRKQISILLLPTCFYTVDTHKRKMLKSLVTMSRVTYFILGTRENCVSQNTVKNRNTKVMLTYGGAKKKMNAPGR